MSALGDPLATYIKHIETEQITLCAVHNGAIRGIRETSIVKNNRGEYARVRDQFGAGIPAESESIPGEGAWKPGEILIQHQMHDGRGKCRLVSSGVVDIDGGLSWVIDSTTTAGSGTAGQEESAPLVINVGEAKGTYLTLFADGRLSIRHGSQSIGTTIPDLIEMLTND